MNRTKHAFEKMRERGFTVEMLGKVLRMKTIRREPSKKEGFSRIVAKVDGSYWTLIVSDDMKTLITVRRAHEDEEQEARES